MIRLSRPIELSKALKNIKPICLPIKECQQIDNMEEDLHSLTLAGWGYSQNSDNDAASDVLIQAIVPYLPQDICKMEYSEKKIQNPSSKIDIHSTQLCAGSVGGLDLYVKSFIFKKLFQFFIHFKDVGLRTALLWLALVKSKKENIEFSNMEFSHLELSVVRLKRFQESTQECQNISTGFWTTFQHKMFKSEQTILKLKCIPHKKSAIKICSQFFT